MDKWEKVVTLHRILRHSIYAVPLDSILDELNCSEATFHRIRNYMINTLGAPIKFDSKYGGYHYHQNDGPYELPGFWLTKDETEALLCIDSSITSMGDTFFSGLLAPVRRRFESMLSAQSTRIRKIRKRIKIIPISSRNHNPEIFREAASAVIHSRRINISHQPLDKDTPLDRDVSPQALVRYRDNWYLDAWCHKRNDLRTFALNRIHSIKKSNLLFYHVPEKLMRAFFEESYGIFTGKADKTAIIDFTSIAAREVSTENWHPRQKGEWIDKDTYRLSIPYNHPKELIMDILRWGENAQVIDPPQLRDEIINTIVKMRKKYEKN